MDWLRLFRLTKLEYYADFFITPPFTIALLVVSIQSGISALWFAELVLGLISWSLYEYVLHRWILHHAWIFRDIHEMHHSKQSDYNGIHPAITLVLYAALWAMFGFGSSPLMIGFTTGYIAYSILHTLFHYARIDSGHWLYKAKMRHVAHHRRDVNFGVTTSIWDRRFGSEG